MRRGVSMNLAVGNASGFARRAPDELHTSSRWAPRSGQRRPPPMRRPLRDVFDLRDWLRSGSRDYPAARSSASASATLARIAVPQRVQARPDALRGVADGRQVRLEAADARRAARARRRAPARWPRRPPRPRARGAWRAPAAGPGGRPRPGRPARAPPGRRRSRRRRARTVEWVDAGRGVGRREDDDPDRGAAVLLRLAELVAHGAAATSGGPWPRRRCARRAAGEGRGRG